MSNNICIHCGCDPCDCPECPQCRQRVKMICGLGVCEACYLLLITVFM